MECVRYVCASSSKKIDGSLDENAAWFEFHQVAHLFDISLQQATKLLRQAGKTGDIDAARDVRSSDCCKCLLSHRAVVAVGYQADYGRATAFRRWCASGLAVLFR
jgi:hypothetical protein